MDILDKINSLAVDELLTMNFHLSNKKFYSDDCLLVELE